MKTCQCFYLQGAVKLFWGYKMLLYLGNDCKWLQRWTWDRRKRWLQWRCFWQLQAWNRVIWSSTQLNFDNSITSNHNMIERSAICQPPVSLDCACQAKAENRQHKKLEKILKWPWCMQAKDTIKTWVNLLDIFHWKRVSDWLLNGNILNGLQESLRIVLCSLRE